MGTTMSKTPIYPLVDLILDGHLREMLERERAGGASFDGIARTLLTEHKVSVSSEVVRKWCIEQGLWTAETAAAS